MSQVQISSFINLEFICCYYLTSQPTTMKNQVKSCLLAITIIFSAVPCICQVDVGADFVSRYLWRGQLLANGPSIQPSISFTKGSFEIGAWGSYGLASGFDGTEADIYATFSVGPVSATLTDYFFPSDRSGVDFDNYFEYDKDLTGHVLEVMLSYEVDDFPLSIDVAYDFYGADHDNSFYIGLGYSISDQTELFVEGGNGWYSFESSGDDSFGLVSIGLTHTKEIKFSETFSLPIFGTIAINPDGEKLFLVFGISF